jgi:DNA-binding XRE family transcriptional regulator
MKATFPNIEAERARAGMTLDEFTNAIGVCRKTYHNWRNSGSIPNSKAIEIAKLFSVPVEYITLWVRPEDIVDSICIKEENA